MFKNAYKVEYLRTPGYNARSLSFGANGFMHNFTQVFNEKVFQPERDIADFPLFDGKNPNLQTTANLSTGNQAKVEKASTSAPIKKKHKTSGGGC